MLPDPKWDAWLLERKYPEQYSRKHLYGLGKPVPRKSPYPYSEEPASRGVNKGKTEDIPRVPTKSRTQPHQRLLDLLPESPLEP